MSRKDDALRHIKQTLTDFGLKAEQRHTDCYKHGLWRALSSIERSRMTCDNLLDIQDLLGMALAQLAGFDGRKPYCNNVNELRNRKKFAFLVYQSGLANVFIADNKKEGNQPQRLMQGNFEECANFAKGLAAAGLNVTTAWCNEAGDISDSEWQDIDTIENAPFHEAMIIVQS